jgi:hypothetical protein
VHQGLLFLEVIEVVIGQILARVGRRKVVQNLVMEGVPKVEKEEETLIVELNLILPAVRSQVRVEVKLEMEGLEDL